MTDLINTIKYLSIGAFSELSGISRKNLIYYDTVGILKPLLVKENGYRYYSYSQLDEVSVILALKDLDIPLKKIKKYLENISPDNLIDLISKQKQKILEELNRLNQMNYIIEQRSQNIPVLESLNCSDILLQNCEEELLFLGPKQPFCINNIEQDFDNFLTYSKSKKLVYGYPLGICSDYNEIVSDCIDTYHYFYRVHPNIEIDKTSKPAGLYVIAYDNSYLAGDMKIFERLEKFIRKNKISACGNVYIENISDEIITNNPDKYYSKISVHVIK
nr:MerR family transcriptional regulator [uncultured Aminipila sp.]